MASKTRVANKTLWALEDITAHCLSARSRWQYAMQSAERNLDPAMMLYLARIRDDIAEIERLASDARNGDYHSKKDQS